MASSYFQFKQFRVDQDRCAMKVTTDACMLGGFTALHQPNPSRVLDIGSGTGLLSLMLAQAFEAPIDAVELDTDAAQQSRENFDASHWGSRLHIHHQSIQDFAKEATEQYELIISNPPYFANHLKNEEQKKSQARHTDTLSFEELTHAVRNLLKPQGHFYLILPIQQTDLFKKAAHQNHLHLQKQINIRDRAETAVIRQVLVYSTEQTDCITEDFVIKKEIGVYSDVFVALLKAYYLYL